MAEGKKSFLLYCDIIHTVRHLPKDKQADLFIHILEYVNDENPASDDILINLAFEPIKHQLKRDLKKYVNIVDRNRENGKLGGRPKKPKKPTGLNGNPKKPKKADNDNDNDTDIEDTNVSIKKEVYKKVDFLKDWNELRTKHLKKPSFVNQLSNYDHSEFKTLCQDYTRKDFQNAMIGLFKQKKLPNDNTTMQSNPKHFLTHFNSYITAFHDKNESLYGKKQIQE